MTSQHSISPKQNSGFRFHTRIKTVLALSAAGRTYVREFAANFGNWIKRIGLTFTAVWLSGCSLHADEKALVMSEQMLATLSFTNGNWHTVPQDLPLGTTTAAGETVTPDWLWCIKSFKGGTDGDWQVQATTLAKLDSGLELEAGFATWRNHHSFPTLTRSNLPVRNWSGLAAVELEITSERATGQIVTLALHSENANTGAKDYFVQDFTVNWSGTKTVRLPAGAFKQLGEPVGIQQIDGLFLFTKIYRRTPNPYTVLHLKKLMVLTAEDGRARAPTTESAAPEAFVYRIHHQDAPQSLNHPFPETTQNTGLRSYAHQHYFQAERALFNYFPRYTPGYPSFSADGRAAINAGETIQFLDAGGNWQASDVKTPIIAWAKAQGWAGVLHNWGMQGADPTVRLDENGEAWVLQQVARLDSAGNSTEWQTRTALLLHSRDHMQTWDGYELPGRIARMEKLDAHNHDALKRPPIILLGDYKYFPNSDQAGYLLIPEKQADGSLKIPEPIAYASNCLGVGYHSGDGNTAITAGDKVYIAWSWYPQCNAVNDISAALTALEKDAIRHKYGFKNDHELLVAYAKNPAHYPDVDLDDPIQFGWSTAIATARYGMPPIPSEHPGLTQKFKMRRQADESTAFAHHGTPAFVTAFNLKTGKMEPPVYVGSGGGRLDDHNFPAMTIDSKGFLHVLINGHHEPLNYTQSLRPYDHSAWTAPTYLIADPDGKRGYHGQAALSYATLNCDVYDTLHTVNRSTSFRYDNSLSYHRKPANAAWGSERTLVKPFKNMYKVWAQRMSYNPITHRFFLTFYSQASMTWLTWDMLTFYSFIWPDIEIAKHPESGWKKIKPQRGWGGDMIQPGAAELTVLVSDDDGDTWRPAVTADFAANQAK